MLETLLLGLAIAIAMEGAAYALFPGGMKRAIALALDMKTDQLRFAGLVALFLGVVLVAFLVR